VIGRRRFRRAPTTLATIVALLCLPMAGAASAHAAASRPRVASAGAASRVRPFQLPPVRHVFVIMLENQRYTATFGNPSADPYLAQTLPAEGALLENYYATGHESNDNYISIVSGQPPNAQNQADCPRFDNFAGALMLENGVESGTGCVYPAEVSTIGNQLSAAKRSWKAYMQDMGNDPNREGAACGHPAIETTDETQKAEAGDGYASRHDPFVYFHSVIDEQRFCDKHVVALGSPSGEMPAAALHGESGLAADLRTAAKTPKFSFITPNLCSDGHDYPCTNEPSGASALADIDAFLEAWVPKITSSPAYVRNGLLEIVFDEAASSEAESCCEEMPGPGSPLPGIVGPGGGRVGAVLLSPFVKAGTVSSTAYNHYSSLASWEMLLRLPKLAYAATVPSTFGADVFEPRPGG
jgi:phosphatidylinositol-3-phosphatase